MDCVPPYCPRAESACLLAQCFPNVLFVTFYSEAMPTHEPLLQVAYVSEQCAVQAV